MTWTLNATGNASDEGEQALVADLKAVLSKHDAGTLASGFNGETHRGPVHDQPPAQDATPSPDEAPAE